ncbi:hypothetical protein TRFO_07443 [Tritrichomonas foetus]|uniref:Uncharacterized protein n=1 Tax=Tritrichomonas foetus TaxID=1144522 RepID=A0A1J4JX58_9EUKA|nr:hypothetical protein TRFO_07443 [Tritrichomonas foetus]|eukprot:OHT01861.1 hypothetical protein TRFO_07443 [Tritrichomonas foetus]
MLNMNNNINKSHIMHRNIEEISDSYSEFERNRTIQFSHKANKYYEQAINYDLSMKPSIDDITDSYSEFSPGENPGNRALHYDLQQPPFFDDDSYSEFEKIIQQARSKRTIQAKTRNLTPKHTNDYDQYSDNDDNYDYEYHSTHQKGRISHKMDDKLNIRINKRSSQDHSNVVNQIFENKIITRGQNSLDNQNYQHEQQKHTKQSSRHTHRNHSSDNDNSQYDGEKHRQKVSDNRLKHHHDSPYKFERSRKNSSPVQGRHRKHRTKPIDEISFDSMNKQSFNIHHRSSKAQYERNIQDQQNQQETRRRHRHRHQKEDTFDQNEVFHTLQTKRSRRAQPANEIVEIIDDEIQDDNQHQEHHRRRRTHSRNRIAGSSSKEVMETLQKMKSSNSRNIFIEHRRIDKCLEAYNMNPEEVEVKAEMIVTEEYQKVMKNSSPRRNKSDYGQSQRTNITANSPTKRSSSPTKRSSSPTKQSSSPQRDQQKRMESPKNWSKTATTLTKRAKSPSKFTLSQNLFSAKINEAANKRSKSPALYSSTQKTVTPTERKIERAKSPVGRVSLSRPNRNVSKIFPTRTTLRRRRTNLY